MITIYLIKINEKNCDFGIKVINTDYFNIKFKEKEK